MKCVVRLFVLGVLGTSALLCAADAPEGMPVITVDMVNATITPPRPVVNIASGDAVVVQILPRSSSWRTNVVAIADDSVEGAAWGSDIVVNFGTDKEQVANIKVVRKQDPTDEGRHYNTFFIKTGIRTIGLRITYLGASKLDSDASARKTESARSGISEDTLHAIVRNTPLTVPIRAESKPFRLQFSAGFGFLAQRDERFGLRPRPNDEGNADIVPLSRGDWTTRLVTFAHYTPNKTPWFALSFGIGTDLPSTGITAMLGPSIRLTTLPIVDSMFITGGIAYLPRQRLLPSYELSNVASASIDTKDLTGARYGFGPFIAVSFSFLGGSGDDIKAVYAGKPPTTD